MEHYTFGGAGHWVSAQVQRETFTLKDMQPGARVVFLVRARNEHGLSPPSLLSNKLGLEGEKEQDQDRQKTDLIKKLSTKQVVLGEAAVLGARKAKLSWRISQQSEQIRGYHIHTQEMTSSSPSQSDMDLTTLTISGPGATQHTISHLKAYTKYRAFIVPYTLSGLARPSNLQTFTTREDEPDTFPGEVELKLYNSTAAVVYWRRPAQANLNGELTGYKIEIFSNDSMVTNLTLEATATSLLLSNLTTAAIYTVRLAVFNRAGVGPFSPPVSLKVEPSLLYRPQAPHPSHAFPPEAPLPPANSLVTQSWSVPTSRDMADLCFLQVCLVRRPARHHPHPDAGGLCRRQEEALQRQELWPLHRYQPGSWVSLSQSPNPETKLYYHYKNAFIRFPAPKIDSIYLQPPFPQPSCSDNTKIYFTKMPHCFN